MAVVLGHNPTQTNDYFELTQKVKLQTQLIDELIKLNQGQEAEITRLVMEYDKLYERYQHSLKFNKVQPNE
jgi:predicted ATPase